MTPYKTSKKPRETDRADRIEKLIRECEDCFEKTWAGTWNKADQIVVARSRESLDIVFAAVDTFELMLEEAGYPIARVERRQICSDFYTGPQMIVVVMK